jgi:hypothetical protein
MLNWAKLAMTNSLVVDSAVDVLIHRHVGGAWHVSAPSLHCLCTPGAVEKELIQ